jgi:TolB protein
MLDSNKGLSKHAAVFVAIVMLLTAVIALEAGPNRYGHSDRVERHMLPAVSTGPMDPAWSPDGVWIAFSMRGDIWKVPADGGVAVALTEGPNYHFEPKWSRDGSRIALSMDIDGNLEIGVVDAEGGEVTRVTMDPQVDVQPEWSADGLSVYFVSARDRGFRIYQRSLVDSGGGPETDRALVREIASGVQPALSPDGTQIAFQGGGGLSVVSVDGLTEPTLVRREETEYRMRPAWAADGHGLFYVSDERGSNDIVALPVGGGSPVIITADTLGEYAPAVSPDGTRIAFVSNREGPTTLYTTSVAGGPVSSWRPVAIERRSPRAPEGRLTGRILGPDGRPISARVYLSASDGRGYAPDGSYHRVISVTETHYFHTDGTFEVDVPAGPVSIEVMRGHEFVPVAAEVTVPAGSATSVELRLERLVDLPSKGWYSGDTHLHDLHQGRFGLTHEDFFLQTEAEDLHVANALIHMDGTRLMGRWDDLTGRDHPLSTESHILRYSQEFRGQLGHISILGTREFILPLISGTGGTVYSAPTLDLPYLDGARAQGGLAGYNHPYINAVDDPRQLAGSAIPMDIALGRGDFYDIGAVYSDEMRSTEIYYRILNAGFRLPATGGTDNFSDVWRDPPPGADRTYVQIDGPLTFDGWLDGIRAHRTFGSTGPIVLIDVDGHGPGEEIAVGPNAPGSHDVRVEMWSVAAIDSLEIIVNGEVAAALSPSDSRYAVLETRVDLPEGGWIAARARGPASRYVTDSYAFAQTSPVYVVRGGQRWTSAADARFLADAVRSMRERVADGQWRGPAQRDEFLSAADDAIGIYEAIANR